jgi:hypothetical protein
MPTTPYFNKLTAERAKALTTVNLVTFDRANSMDLRAAEKLKLRSASKPKVLIGWQILLFAKDKAQEGMQIIS